MRSKSMWGVGLSALGVILLAVAAVLAWVVVPNQAKLPADTNTTRQYQGTAKVLLNAEALATNNVSRAILTDVPVTASRTVKALATDGDKAQVSDSRTLLSGSTKIGQTEAVYAVDRKTLENPGSHPDSWKVINQQGLTVSWPIGAKQQDYTGWVNETQTTTPLHYVRQEQRGGVNTYVFEADAPAAPIKDQQVLSTLPPALPVSALAALGPSLPIPDTLKAQLRALIPQLTQPIPLSYTYSAQSTYWVEPTTGLVVDTKREEIRRASLGLPGVPAGLATVPVYDVVTQITAQSVSDAGKQAGDDKNRLTLYGKTLPITFLVVGAVALLVGIALFVLGRRGPTAAAGGPGPERMDINP